MEGLKGWAEGSAGQRTDQNLSQDAPEEVPPRAKAVLCLPVLQEKQTLQQHTKKAEGQEHAQQVLEFLGEHGEEQSRFPAPLAALAQNPQLPLLRSTKPRHPLVMECYI